MKTEKAYHHPITYRKGKTSKAFWQNRLDDLWEKREELMQDEQTPEVKHMLRSINKHYIDLCKELNIQPKQTTEEQFRPMSKRTRFNK